jgi:hypothetical protein
MRYGIIIVAVTSLGCATEMARSTAITEEDAIETPRGSPQIHEIDRQLLSFAEAQAIRPEFVILALDALRKDNTACAQCLLNAELDSQLKIADPVSRLEPA